MTERLYYADAYLQTFEARVVERAEGGRRIYLDRSAFYPTSGGQLFDTGTLGSIAVVDVVDEDDRVAHLLAAPLPESSAAVAGRIDWARRYDHMQQHTGQHLLSALFAERFGLETVSVHFGADSSTLDLAAESVAREQLVAVEEGANAIVVEHRPVMVTFEDAQMAAGLRKASDRTGTLRIVTIDRIDRSACGGTHVRSTGEIGALLIRRQERVRKTTRVEFVCGARAVRRARADYEALAATAQVLSSAIDDVPALVRTQQEEQRALVTARRGLDTRLAAYRAAELYAAAPANASGVRRVVEQRETGVVDDLRAVAQAVMALPGGVFVGVIAQPPTILLAASNDSALDAGALLKRALVAVGGRGGGSARMAQGSVPDAASLERVLAEVLADG